MPYPAPLAKLTWGGTAYSNTEIWQCGLHLSGTKVPGSPEMAPVLQALVKWMNGQYGSHRLTWCKWAGLDVEGHYADQNSPVLRDMDTSGGISISDRVPPGQLTLAVTLLSDKKRGGAVRGRMYPPPIPFAIDRDGLVNTTQQGQEVQRHATLIKAINTAADGFFGQVVLASKGGKKIQPAIEPVTALSVGRVVDTQRRRRNNLPEVPIRVPL